MNYSKTYIDVIKGLSNNYVTKIIEDDIGFKWIATEGGLNKYDGINFTVYTPQNVGQGLNDENIETLYCDKDNHMWIGTKSGGLSRYDPIHDKFEDYNHLLGLNTGESIRITKIIQDGKGRIWAGAYDKHGLYVIDPEKKVLVSHYFKGERINALIMDQYQNIWFTHATNIHKYDPSEDRVISQEVGKRLFALSEDKHRKRIWMSSDNRLYYLDIQDYKIYEHKFFPTNKVDKNIHRIALDHQHRLLVGTWGSGMYISDTTTEQFHKLQLSFPYLGRQNVNYESILDIHVDKNYLIWLSTAYGGVIKLSPEGEFKYIGNQPNEQIGLTDNNIQQLYFDDQKRLWIGTYGGGVNLSYDYKTFRPLPELPFAEVYAFLETDKWFLIGARQGLFGLNKHDIYGTPVHFCPHIMRITALHLDTEGRLWVGTKQNGIGITDLAKDPNLSELSFNRWSGKMRSNRISTFTEDKQGDIWIGTYGGLHLYNREEGRLLSPEELSLDMLPSRIIHSIHTEGNKLWLAMPSGLAKCIKQRNGVAIDTIYNTNTGLSNNFITTVTSTKNGEIWLSSVQGISRLVEDTGVIVNYGTSDGLKSSAYNIGCFTESPSGLFFFGGINGITSFNPSKVDGTSHVPNLIFSEFYLDDRLVKVDEVMNGRTLLTKVISKTEKICLEHDEDDFSFVLSSTDYLGHDNITYEYRLKSLKDDWVENSTGNIIKFIGLKPGDYKLEVRASRNRQNWSEIETIDLSILPPFWATWYAYVVYFALFFAIIFSVRYVAVSQARLKSKLQIAKIGQEKEHELTETKLNFFTNISHEFRTPLTLIISPLTEILAEYKLDHVLKTKLSDVQSNASRLMELINQLLDFRKADKGMLKLQVAEGNFSEFVREIFLSFKGLADSRDISYKLINPNPWVSLCYDRDKMEIVLCNLLSNAFKYCRVKGNIELSVAEHEKTVTIRVSDDGPGIPEKYRGKIFNRFFQIKVTNSLRVVGSGIGLSFTKKIIDLHGGTITVTSPTIGGSKFEVTLPKGTDHFDKEDVILDFKGSDHPDKYEVKEKRLPSSEMHFGDLSTGEVESQKKTLLIVDDNQEILKYLDQLLASEYRIIQAPDGKIALDKARDEVPDLVVSDVMMPEMDGIELCEKLKSDMVTSHIPVILLTARTATVFEVNGLKTGADDYVKKPFDATILKARISSLLENRDNLREYYLRKVQFEPDQNLETTDFEQQFIMKAAQCVEEHIFDDKFGRDELADELCMSRSSLFRKIKSLTGLSTSAFIKALRLKKAAEKIYVEDGKLSQIAFEVGFKDYKHFKQSFKNQFGCLPSEYRNKKLSNNSVS